MSSYEEKISEFIVNNKELLDGFEKYKEFLNNLASKYLKGCGNNITSIGFSGADIFDANAFDLLLDGFARSEKTFEMSAKEISEVNLNIIKFNGILLYGKISNEEICKTCYNLWVDAIAKMLEMGQTIEEISEFLRDRCVSDYISKLLINDALIKKAENETLKTFNAKEIVR